MDHTVFSGWHGVLQKYNSLSKYRGDFPTIGKIMVVGWGMFDLTKNGCTQNRSSGAVW
jgi:hypothetical protein